MIITDLSKTEGDFTLQIDRMELMPGKIHGLVGHNGSGKTILLKCIMGILTPDRGTIDYEGLTPQDITLMSQRPYLLHASVYDNLVYPLKVRGQRPDETEMDRLLERVGLLAQKKQYARSLSSGERQKLSFLRAIVFGPKFVMMDETLSNMDPGSEAVILDLLRQTQAERPITWLIVNHQLEQKKELCDVLHRMEKGRYCGITEG
ncbi:MAG: ATP-binding cassette domain-containing protein [Anaerovoracaceae bacterium]